MELIFDSTGIKPNAGLAPIPLDTYDVMIVGSGKEDTTAKDGSYLFFELKIISGPLSGRTQVDRMNLWNKSAQAVEIAKGRLSAYCHVTGVYKSTNTEQYHGIPFKASIGPQMDGKQPSDKYSEVKALFDKNGNAPLQAAGTPPPATAQGAPPFPVQSGFAPPAPIGFASVPSAPETATPPAFAPLSAPPAVPPPPPAPPAPPAVFPPEGWTLHPQAPGYYYKGQEMKTEAELRALNGAPAPTQFGAPAAVPAATPPWQV